MPLLTDAPAPLATAAAPHVRRLTLGLLAGLALMAAAPALAHAELTSANWAGYAIHGANVSFSHASGSWKVPSASCRRGNQAFSAAWVGLGGYTAHSRALEQTGTETDCSPSGKVVTFAWYELVPQPSHHLPQLPISPGDTMNASVTVSGSSVTLILQDVTKNQTFQRTFSVQPIDLSSAEWILEAPSVCRGGADCRPLPLANFGTMGFTSAGVTTTSGTAGSISNALWQSTEIRLASHPRGFLSTGPTGVASPSALETGGAAFTVSYNRSHVTATPPPFAQSHAPNLLQAPLAR